MSQAQFVVITVVLIFIFKNAQGAFNLFEFDRSNELQRKDDSKLLLPVSNVPRINYFGESYDYLGISSNGNIYFEPIGSTFEDIDFDQHRPFPQTYVTPMIMQLYLRTTFIEKTFGHVYYQFHTSQNSFLTNMTTYVREFVLGAQRFIAISGLIVTWEQVQSQHDMETCPTNIDCRTNTFQTILLWSRTETYVIFNYANVKSLFYTQAGFSQGRAREWQSVAELISPGIAPEYFPGLLAGDVPGRFIFMVSGNVIHRGGCLPRRQANAGTIEVHPRYGGMFGGNMVDVSSVCLLPGDQVSCKFHGVMSHGIAVSSMLVRCNVPMLIVRGEIFLEVKVNDIVFVTSFYVALPGVSPYYVKLPFGRLGPGWNETNPDQLRMAWKPSLLSKDQNATVSIDLIGYKETSTNVFWKKLNTLGSGVSNSNGKFQFDRSKHSCIGDNCRDFEIGLVVITLEGSAIPTRNKFITTGVLPLGWYMSNSLTLYYGSNWTDAMCQRWYNIDKQQRSWEDQLLYCPCTLSQVLADFGRWQPDSGCNIYTGSKCYYHQDTVHCARAVQPTPNGSGNQCCYGYDGELKYASDSYQGSTPDLGNEFGAFPYGAKGRVPVMSHWLNDVVTFYYCCLYVDYKSCDYYMAEHRTRDCKYYAPPATAMLFGEAHAITFDNQAYTLHGLGDFVLLSTNGLSLHGRLRESPQGNTNGLNVSILVGICVKDTTTNFTIEFLHRPFNHKHKINVYAMKKYRPFDEPILMWQDFSGISVINRDSPYRNSQSNFTVLTESNIGIQVAVVNDLMQLTVMIPPELKGKTSGLLGTWDNDPHNDFTTRDNSILAAPSSQDITRKFVSSWAVKSKEESLFREFHKEIMHYQPTYTVTIPGIAQFAMADVTTICGSNKFCQYDYLVTGDITVAKASLNMMNWHRTMREFLQPVKSCGLLDVSSARKDSYNYTLGSTVEVIGCRNGHHLQQESSYTCVQAQNGSLLWIPNPVQSCSGVEHP